MTLGEALDRSEPNPLGWHAAWADDQGRMILALRSPDGEVSYRREVHDDLELPPTATLLFLVWSPMLPGLSGLEV